MTDSVRAPALDDPTQSISGAPVPRTRDSPPTAASDSADRYEQERLLGRGAMGAVYLVRDRETGERLALKKLFHMDARSVLRLKREFRAVADMSHPNLVKVYELGHAEDGYFLAMEYVPGQDLQTHLGFDTAAQASSRIDAALSQFASRRAWLQESVLPAFHQLASGVHALHRAGMLHRDLKPSNVLVAAARVVVLDFGLVRELDPNAPKLTEDGAIAGTPAYMAPEQALGKALSEASDWYAFGAMLYEALTGTLPFDGSLMELLRSKVDCDPPPPNTIVPDIPPELSALCMALLSRDPQQRPRGGDVLARLEPVRTQSVAIGLLPSGETSLQTEGQAVTGAPFFGRKQELGTLWQALHDAQAGHSQVVHVRGVSGAGKSALVEHFLDDLEHESSATGHSQALVLRSRCYEREAMPFKALDGVVDALTRHLSNVDDLEVSHLMPADIGALAQLFPVLERLHAVQRLLSHRSQGGDAVQSRQRAELAFRDLLSRLSARRPVVIWIDDLQWGDLDSAGIVKGFLQRALELPLIWLLSYRSDEVETSECLRVLLSTKHEVSAPITLVQVTALPSYDLCALCREQLGALARGREALIEHIVREADGSPFLAAQLTALAQAKLTRGDADVAALSLTSMVAQTAALLPADARLFLRVLAIAGRPIAPKLALRAAGLRGGGREIIHTLRRQLLVRTRDVGGEKLIEVYHDRVRENVQRAVSAEDAEQLHGNLLRALEFSGRADPDWLHAHALGAKQQRVAFRYGLAAAERAMGTLAFEHAAELYARCIELSDAEGDKRSELMHKLADALACCGRGVKAADAYLEASTLASGGDAVKLMRLATSHLFRSGRFTEAEAMLRRVLVAMNVRMPESALGVLFALLWERVQLALRGSRFTPRSEADVPAAVLERIDAFSILCADLRSVDSLRSTWFMLRVMRWALDAGESRRLLLALSGMCQLISMRGTPGAERGSQQLLAQIAALSEKLGTPAARAILCITQAVSFWMRRRPADVLAPSYEAERLCREQPLGHVGDYHMRFGVVTTRIGALYQLGDYAAFAAELRAALQEAHATDNHAALLTLALNETLLDEIQDRADEAVARLTQQRLALPQTGFGVYHALHMIAVCCAATASGQHAWGRRVLDEYWPRFLRSPVRRAATISLAAARWRIGLLLNEYSDEDCAEPYSLARIRTERKASLRRIGHGSEPYTVMTDARLAYLQGDKGKAIRLLRHVVAVPGFDVQLTRYALGHLLEGEEGAALCTDSLQQMLAVGIVNPLRMVRTTYPEMFRERRGQR